MRRRTVLIFGGVVCLQAAQAQQPELRRPESVLITTDLVDGAGIQDPKARQLFGGIYNAFLKQVMEGIESGFRADNIPTAIYVHRDLTTGRRAAVLDHLFKGKHDGLVQLDYAFQSGAGGNRTLLNCVYMRLEVPPSRWAGGTAKFVTPYSKSYLILSENSSDSPRTGAIASDFLRGIRGQTYGNPPR